MPPTQDRSVHELREECERARGELAATIGELRDKVGETATELKTLVSPAHIKKEIRNYVSVERESVMQSIQQRAKDNPLQVAAIGAAIAYPAWSLLRALPTPLLLIGAGLFLTSKSGQQSAKDIQAKVGDIVQQGTEKVSDVAGAMRSEVDDQIAGARYRAEELRDTVTSSVSTMADRTQTMFRAATDTAKGAIDSAKSAVGDAASQTASRVKGFRAAAGEGTEFAKDQTAEMGSRTRDALTTFVNDNPLLVAALGAAVGAFIAASIPSSDAENELFGQSSEKLKDKAREAAAQGIKAAGNIAAEAAGSVATAAAREGLDAAGVQNTLNSIADGVRKVADRGLDAALGAAPQSGQQPTTQRNAT